ncbi:MAG: oligopeptide/dipeptide ABC transporter ATP-binding protein [Ilumatobacteraceae bacterium]
MLACLPRLDRRLDLIPIGGSPPALDRLPQGCAFHTRCPLAIERCLTEVPQLRMHARTAAACHVAPLDAPALTGAGAAGGEQASS